MAKERKNTKRDFKGKPPSEFEQRIIDLARVTRVMAGGKRLRFRACVALGDKKGRVGWAVAKGADVAIAVNKAVNKAKKNIIKTRLVNDTIPHKIEAKYGAARVMLKPAVKGTGIIAGGAVRNVLELAGIPNIYGKILSRTNNKINNVQATFKALKSLKYPEKLEGVEEKFSEANVEDGQEMDLGKEPSLATPYAEALDAKKVLEDEEELEKEQEKLLKKEGLDEDNKITLKLKK